VAPLIAAGMTVLNASPGSTLNLWPMVVLEDTLKSVG